MKNNKTFKKLTGIATAAVIAGFSMIPLVSTTASAANSCTITIANTQSGHTYEAYQVFSGDLSGSTLSNIDWGTGVNGPALLSELKTSSFTGSINFSGCNNAADVAEILSDNNTNKTFAEEFAAIVGKHLTNDCDTSGSHNGTGYTITTDDDGYYFVKDKDSSLQNANDSYTSFIIQTIGPNTPVTIKTGLPEFEKKVKDINDTEDTTSTGWQDSADYDINDHVPFLLKATIASNYTSYDAYKFSISDTLGTGLTYDNNAKVYVNGTETSGFNIAYSSNILTISCDNLKTIGSVTDSSVITVEYTATLNNSANVGATGNPNTASLTYSNNPNDEDGSETGKTPDDKVMVFTYEAVINKVDNQNQALEGAKFKLSKKLENGSYSVVKDFTADTNNLTSFTFKGLDDGIYKLEETVTPASYNTIEPVYFKVEADHVISSNAPTLTSVTATQIDEAGNTVSPNGFNADNTDNYKIKANIQNNKGSELPSTGGIGTAPFYIGGGALVVAAGVFIIVKRRMKNNENK